MSYLLAETGGLLLASMILGCALGYLVGLVRRGSVTSGLSSPSAATGDPEMAADDRVVYEDNLRRARAEIVRLEKQNNRMTGALTAARPMPDSGGAAPTNDRWDASSAVTTRDPSSDLGFGADDRDAELARRDSELSAALERLQLIEDELATRDHEIEELEESIREMHQRTADAKPVDAGATAGSALFGATGVADDQSGSTESDQLRLELEQSRARLVRLDERQLELDQLVSRLRGPAARAERLEAETGRLRDRLRLREARLRELEQGLAETGLSGSTIDHRRGGSAVARRSRTKDGARSAAAKRNIARGGTGGETVGDLTRIDGIGPVLARMLHQRGVSSISDLAELNEKDIAGLEAQLPEFATRIRRDRWVEQAQQMLSKRHTR